MARGKRDGLLIAGGGLAGCLAALAMARFRPEIPVLIVEEKERFGAGQFRSFPEADLEERELELVDPLVEHRWPGFYVAFPEVSRKLKAPWASFGADRIHEAMVAALRPDRIRLGTKVVAVREDALVLDGGETIKADGAIDARGPANLSMLELLHETRFERGYRFEKPHRVDRPVLIDATVDQAGGLRFVQCIPLSDDRLLVADVAVSERVQPDEHAAARLDLYVEARGWAPAAVEAERSVTRPLPIGGDFAAFWRIGGARVAKLGLRGGFVHPATGRTVGDAVRMAVLLAAQRDYSGAALHDLFEDEAKQLWKKRETYRELNQAVAGTLPEQRRALFERFYRLDPGLIARFHADDLGLIDRMRVQRALREG